MNFIKKTKYSLYRIKGDLKSLFGYPQVDLSTGYRIDYGKYWKKRRGDYYKSSLSDWQKERADYALQFLKSGDVVVDVGGGDGEVLKYIKSKVAIRGICVDFDEMVLDEAKNNDLEIVKMDLSDMVQLGKLPDCDYILGFEVLEHLPNPEEFLMVIKNKVRKGMIFSFPNTGYYTYRLRLFFGRFPAQWIVHPGEHLRFWTVADTRSWISKFGLNIRNLKTYQGLPLLNRLIPNIFGAGIILMVETQK